MPDLRLGSCSTDALEFTFERVEDTLRLLLVNADESGSMGGRTQENVTAYEKVAAVLGGRADVVILHGFESDSHYDVFLTEGARARLGSPKAVTLRVVRLGCAHAAPRVYAQRWRGKSSSLDFHA